MCRLIWDPGVCSGAERCGQLLTIVQCTLYGQNNVLSILCDYLD